MSAKLFLSFVSLRILSQTSDITLNTPLIIDFFFIGLGYLFKIYKFCQRYLFIYTYEAIIIHLPGQFRKPRVRLNRSTFIV